MLRYLTFIILALAWVSVGHADLPGSADAALLSQLLSDLAEEKVESVEVESEGGGGEEFVDRLVEVIVEKTNVVEKVTTVEKPVEVIVEKTNVVEKVTTVEKPVEVVVEKTNVVEKVTTVETTNVVETLLVLEKTNTVDVIVEKTNYVEKVVEAPKLTGRPAKITSKATYFDRKEGVGVFTGNVHVDDEQYQLHADKVYLFMEGTNDIRRVVALGHVAMTNFYRMAYADKASYYRQNGMIVLYAGDGIDAEVRDESKSPAQTVRGEKIKFWIDSEQVEVLKAKIETPTSGLKDMKGLVK